MSDKKTLIKSALIGTLCGILSQIILLSIVSIIMLTTKNLFTGVLEYIMIAVSGLGALAGGFIAAKLNRGAGLIAGSITGFAIFIILTAASLVNSDTSLSFLSLIRFIVTLLGGALGGILGVKESTKIKI